MMIRTSMITLRGLTKLSPLAQNNGVLLQLHWRHQPFLVCSNTNSAVLDQPVLSINDYMTKHDIAVSDSKAPPPVLSFEDSGLPDYLLKKLSKDFIAPTPIQAAGLPIALSGSNMVGIGQTGSGKTLAFLLPAFLHIKKERERLERGDDDKAQRKAEGPLVVILAPTRELAKQIEDVARQYRNATRIRSVCCIGGEGRGKQLEAYDAGAELMIATPGRINDFVEVGDMSLKRVGFVVLDEADRMLDMGFEVQDLASEFLGDFTFMKIGSVDLCANKNISQHVEITTKDYKTEQFLIDIEEKLLKKKVLVFTERKATVDRLERLLRNRRVRAMGIHGDKSQRMRSETLQRFKDGSCKVMIATDVAARGLDVNDVDWVVNYDFPLDIENYIHRIGRTGRANKKGSSLTYMTIDDARYAKKLRKILEESDQKVPEDLIELEKEEERAKVVKGKLGKQLQKGPQRSRSYGYRGMGRDDGESTEEYGFRSRRTRNNNYSDKLARNYKKPSHQLDDYGFPKSW